MTENYNICRAGSQPKNENVISSKYVLGFIGKVARVPDNVTLS